MGAAAAGRAVNGDTADKQMMPLEVIRKISLNMFLLLALALIWYGKGFHDRFEPYVDTWMAAATALLLVTLYADANAHERYVTRLFSSKLLVKIGIFSYSLYLVHAPMLHLLDRIWVANLNPGPIVRFLLLVLSIPVIVGAAYLFHLAFERPFLSKRTAVQNNMIQGNTSLETQK